MAKKAGAPNTKKPAKGGTVDFEAAERWARAEMKKRGAKTVDELAKKLVLSNGKKK